MNTVRHRLARESLEIEKLVGDVVGMACSLEEHGNWFSAGEKFCEAAEQVSATSEVKRAKLFVRAATCFEIACQPRAAAQAYSQAAALLEKTGNDFVVAGELHNRAAIHMRTSGEWFHAGICWRDAAAAFEKAPELILSNLDNVNPVPSSAGKFTVAAMCYTAAGDVFKLSGDEVVWSCGAYWEAGKSHQNQGNGYHAFVAYRKALNAVARFYGTHDQAELRRCLPLSDQERADEIDPVLVMEQALHQSNGVHQSRNSGMLAARWARSETERYMIAAYHDFSQTFAEIGNGIEAANYRTLEKERTRRSMVINRRYGRALLYWIWSTTSGYGESLFRWISVCALVLIGFSLVYARFHLVNPVTHWFDYFYFSVVTFTSLGYGDIQPVGIAGKATACIEITSGLVMFGILLSFISNRSQRS